MHALSAHELLELWEHGADRSPAQRALDLLTAAGLEESADGGTGLSVGHRDRALLTLREWTFGASLHGEATCPGCGAELELDFETADVRADPAPGSESTLTVEAEGRHVAFRPPSSADLLAAERESDAPAACALLLERCVTFDEGERAGGAATVLGPASVDAVAASMAGADPQADVRLAVACPDCGSTSLVPFDVDTFFWREIESWAQRTLREVSALAQAHGWTENAVLALSPRRRRFYLEAAGW